MHCWAKKEKKNIYNYNELLVYAETVDKWET